MSRVIVIVVCGFTLAACTSSWMPSFEMPSFGSAPVTTTLSIESDPPGAEAKVSTGGSCRTPCTVSVPASGDFSINLSLNGYLPQSVPVRAVLPEQTRFDSEAFASQTARLDPNPVYVELQQAPPPPPAKKRPGSAAKKPRTAAKSAPQPATASTPPTQQVPPRATPSGAPPWPMPR